VRWKALNLSRNHAKFLISSCACAYGRDPSVSYQGRAQLENGSTACCCVPHSHFLFSVPCIGGCHPPDAPAGKAAGAPGKQRSALILGGTKEKDMFSDVLGDDWQVRQAALTEALLADAQNLRDNSIVVIAPNRLRTASAGIFTKAVQKNLKEFVGNGGDLFLFEQWAADNTKVIEEMFRIHVRGGGGRGAHVKDARLRRLVKEAGISPLQLSEINFYNSYASPPPGTRVLLCGLDKETPTAIVSPSRNGRLIFIGTGLEPNDLPVVRLIIGMLCRGDGEK
jgi:hypothetical protein